MPSFSARHSEQVPRRVVFRVSTLAAACWPPETASWALMVSLSKRKVIGPLAPQWKERRECFTPPEGGSLRRPIWQNFTHGRLGTQTAFQKSNLLKCQLASGIFSALTISDLRN